MEPAAPLPDTARATGRTALTRACLSRLRALGVGLVLWLGAWSLGASAAQAAWLGLAAALAIAFEHLVTRRTWTQALQQASRAATREGERGAEAQRLSLELAYERSRSVLEALREGVLVVDAGGEIVMANPAARRAMQAPTQDPEGRMLWEALTPELGQRAREAWQALRQREGRPEALPQVRYTAIPCRDSVYDLTAVEATSARTGQDFGSVFLLVDSTRAHELQRLKDRFLSSVSHELRTPLTNICAYAEILRTMLPGESAEWPEFVRVIHEEGVQLAKLVDAMFDFLQLESGEALFRSDTVDGPAAVREVLATLQPLAARRQIEVEVVTADVVPQLRLDRERFAQVVRNLLDNAIKFTPPHGRVRIAVLAHDEGFELRVEDSGPGVPAAARRAVFEKFHQLSDHLTDKADGTGLGLATCRAVVARFGGLIWCEESDLGGAAFVVRLPAADQASLVGAAAVGGGF